jgi:hypothetical protein
MIDFTDRVTEDMLDIINTAFVKVLTHCAMAALDVDEINHVEKNSLILVTKTMNTIKLVSSTSSVLTNHIIHRKVQSKSWAVS